MNYWKDIPTGEKTPNEFNVVVEIPRGGRNKYEIDHDTGVLKLDRVLHTSLAYPTNYGFIPQSWYLDDDPLDALVWSREKIVPKCVVKVRPLCILKTVDKVVEKGGKVIEEGRDDKLLTVPINDPFYEKIKSLDDVPHHLLDEIKHFFRRYKELERNKKLEVKEWQDIDKAKEAVKLAIETYNKEFR